MNVYEVLNKNNIILPSAPAKGGIYNPVQFFNENLIYCSGCGPYIEGERNYIGKLGIDFSVDEGKKAAYNCMLNVLANLDKELGDLNRIQRFVKILGFVNCSNSFTEQPQVINGASELLINLFGKTNGCPARSAIGTNALPGNIACEIEVLLELK